MNTADIVRVVNVGDEDFEDMAGGVRYSIPVGGEHFLPLGHVSVWLGNIGEFPPERQRAVELVRWRWQGENEGDWETFRPKLEVYDQNTGERVWFPSDDPEGINADYTPSTAIPTASEKRTQARIEELERMIADLAGNKSGSRNMKRPVTDDVPEDKPDRTPVRP